MRFRVLDIETVPDLTVWSPGEPRWKWSLPLDHDPRSVRTRFAPDEMILVQEEPFPPPHAQRVVAISWVDVVLDAEHSPRYRLGDMHTDCRWSYSGSPRAEYELLRSFGDAVAEAKAAGGLCLVTWNGRTFDLPVIVARSLRHGIPCPWYYEDRDVRYRYSAEGHLDLMDFLADFGASKNMKLGDAARLIGLPGKVGEVTGASVHDVYRETLDRAADPDLYFRKTAEVARYCLQDSIQTAVLFLRSRHHLGKIDRDEYHCCLDTFVRSPEVREILAVDWHAVRVPGEVEAGGTGEVSG